MAATDEAQASRARIVRVDRKAGLDIRGGKIAKGACRAPRLAVLVPGEVAERSRDLPVDLVDDLLEIASDQRLEQPADPSVEPDAVEDCLVVGRPLHHP